MTLQNKVIIETKRKRASLEHPFTEEERFDALHRVAERARLWASSHFPSNESETLRGISRIEIADRQLREALEMLDSEHRSEVPPTPMPEEYRAPMCWPRPRMA